MKEKPIRCWNIGDTRGGSYYIGAHSAAHALRLLNLAAPQTGWTISYFRDFASEAWGNQMQHIDRAVGVWFQKPRYGGKVEKVL